MAHQRSQIGFDKAEPWVTPQLPPETQRAQKDYRSDSVHARYFVFDWDWLLMFRQPAEYEVAVASAVDDVGVFSVVHLLL